MLFLKIQSEKMKVFYPIILIVIAKAVSGQLLSCGNSSVVGHNNKNATLGCNTGSPIVELYWGVKSAEQPNPVLIVIDPSGERPGATIASTNYGGRVFFVGNKATGDASIQIRNLTASDSKDYLWKIDHGGGVGYTKYVMSLTVKPEHSITAAPTTIPSATSSTSPSSSSTTPPSGTSTTPTPTTPTSPPKGLKGWEIGLIVGASIFGALLFGGVTWFIIKKFKESHQDNLPADKKQDTEMKTSSAQNA